MPANPHTMAELKKLIADPFDKQSCLQALSLIPAFPVAVIDKVYEPLRIEIVEGALNVDDSKHTKNLLKSLLLMSRAAHGSLAAKDRQALTRAEALLSFGEIKITNLSPLAGLTSLNSLVLCSCTSLTDLSSLSDLTTLNKLNLLDCWELTELSPLADLTSLASLKFGWCRNLSDLSPLCGHEALLSLELSGSDLLTDLSPLAGLTSLTTLELFSCKKITDLSPLASLTSLTALNLSYCTSITDLNPLAGLTSLTTLKLANCSNLTDLSPLASLTSLTNLYLEGCSSLTDLSPLANLTSLTSLDFRNCDSLTDLSPLSNLNLGNLYCQNDASRLASIFKEQKSIIAKINGSSKLTTKMLNELLDSTVATQFESRLVADDELIATIGKFPVEVIDKVYAKSEERSPVSKIGVNNWKRFLLEAAAKEGSIAHLFSKSEQKSKTFHDSLINGYQQQFWHLPNSVPYWFRNIEKVDVVYSLTKLEGSAWINSFPNLRTLIFYSGWVIDPPSFDPIAESTIEHVEIDLYHAGATLSKKAIQELAKLRNLKELTLRSPCRRDIEAVSSLNLQVLRLHSDSNEGYKSSDLHVLPSLKHLEISGLSEFELSELRSIETLAIDVTSVRLNSLLNVNKLRSLKISARAVLMGDDCTSNSLEELSITDRGEETASFDYVKAFPNLMTLSIESSHFEKVELISGFNHLKTLKLENMKRLNDFSHLLLNSSLESLAIIRSSDYFADRIGVLATLGNLKSLDVSENNHLTNLDFAAAFHDLEILTANHCENLSTIDGLGILTQLKVFSANYCQKLSNIDGLRGLPKLKKLYLFDAEGVKCLDPLADLISLELLDLGLRTSNYSHSQRSGHEILRNLVNLKTLNLAQNRELNDASIDFLNELRALENLILDEVTINSISAILNLPLLSNLNVSGFAGAKSELFIRPEVRIVPPKASTFV